MANSSSGIIDLEEDAPISAVEQQPYEILVEDRPCVKCNGQDSEGKKPIRLSSCGHSAHFKCCTKSRCPSCSEPLTWRDFAQGTSRKEFYALAGGHGGLADDAEVNKALDKLLSAFSETMSTSSSKAPTSRTSRAKKPAAKPRGRGRGGPMEAAAASSGVGYAGSATERGVSAAALEQSRRRQHQEDLVISSSLSHFSTVLQTRLEKQSPLGPELEHLLRTKIKRVSLPSLLQAYLRNGATDVCARQSLYSALFHLLIILAKNEMLCSLLCDSTELPLEESQQDSSEEGSEVLRLVAALDEGLRGLSAGAGDPNAVELQASAEEIKRETLNSVRSHPHFDFSKVEMLVKQARQRQKKKKDAFEKVCSDPLASSADLSKAYESALVEFQFRTISLIDLCAQNLAAHTFVRVNPSTGERVIGTQAMAMMHYSHHHHPPPGFGMPLPYGGGGAASSAAGQRNLDPQRMIRIHKELSNLKTSLPLSWGSSVFAVCDETRMDVIQFMIVGPEGTPYQNGLFVFDCFLGETFPTTAPSVRLQTTGGGRVRFNPNLYKDGKVCLSLLGTWSGPGWDPKTSSLLQVLVSIQSLIMVNDPYFNEPGAEAQAHTPSGKLSSSVYNASIRYQTLRLAILDMVKNPPYAFKDVARLHFVAKRREIAQQMEQWKLDLAQLQQTIATQRTGFATFQVFDSGTSGPVDVNTFGQVCNQVNEALAIKQPTSSSSSALRSGAVQVVELLDDGEADGAAVSAPPAKKPRVVVEGEVVDLLHDDEDTAPFGKKPHFATTHPQPFWKEEEDEEDDDVDYDEEDDILSSGWTGGFPSDLWGMGGGDDDEDDEGGY